jgi:hypothetical protein
MVCYEDSFTSFYLDDVRTSLEINVWSSMACYVDSFIFYFDD